MTLPRQRPLPRSVPLAGATLAAGPLAVACSNSAPATSPSASRTSTGSGAHGAEVTLEAHAGSLGTYLTDQDGRALYLFEADTSTRSSCTGACLSAWPPLTGAAKVGDGVDGAHISAITTADGTGQVTYDGHPLYYFAGDTRAGQTNGEGNDGFGALRWLVTPQGEPLTASGGASSSGSGSEG